MPEIKLQAFIERTNEMVQVEVVNLVGGGIHHSNGFMSDGYILRECLMLTDKNDNDIYNGDILELEVDGYIRRFVASKRTVVRKVESHPSFDDDYAKVSITGVVFEWDGYDLFPCVDGKWVPDNKRMTKVGNVYQNPELLNTRAYAVEQTNQ